MRLKDELKALLELCKKAIPQKRADEVPEKAPELQSNTVKDNKKPTWEPYFKLSDEKDTNSTHIYRGSW